MGELGRQMTNSSEVSIYYHVPPNRAEVLPELDFRQFPMVPREPIPQPLQIRPYKEGFFQRLAFTGTYLDRGASRSTGVTELELSLSVALPWPSVQQPLIVTPGFNTTFLESPTNSPCPIRSMTPTCRRCGYRNSATTGEVYSR
jgi:hypothetical protein